MNDSRTATVSGCEAEGTWQAGALCPERRASGIQSLLPHVGRCPPRRGERGGRSLVERGGLLGVASWVCRVPFGSASPCAECSGSSVAGSSSSALDALGLSSMVLGPFMEEGESSSF